MFGVVERPYSFILLLFSPINLTSFEDVAITTEVVSVYSVPLTFLNPYEKVGKFGNVYTVGLFGMFQGW